MAAAFFMELLAGALGFFGLGFRRPAKRPVTLARTLDEARALLEQIGDRLGFEVLAGANPVQMNGERHGLSVAVEVTSEIGAEQVRFHVRIAVEGPQELPGPMSVEPRERAGPGAWSLGDPRLDDTFRVTAEEGPALVALRPVVRELVVGLSGALQIDGTRLVFEAPRAATFVPRLVDQLCTLHGCLSDTPRVSASALAARVRTEPLAEIRARCLTTLIQRYPDDSITDRSATRSLEDPYAKVRLKAALHLKEAGLACLHGLVVDPAVDSGLRMAAARRLGTATDDLCSQLLAQLVPGEDAAVITALRLLGRLGHMAQLDRVLSVSEDPRRARRVREAARQAVARIQDRYPNAQQGQLSLVEGMDEIGALSVPQAGPGALSPSEGG